MLILMRKWINDHIGWIISIMVFLIMLLIGYYLIVTIGNNLGGVTNITQRLYS